MRSARVRAALLGLPGSITDVPGVEVGHAQNAAALTGCTVIICRRGAVAGVDVRGGAPGTRETDLLDPGSLVGRVHAVLLAGGSAFGLDAAGGVMRYLEQSKVGFDAGIIAVPIVPAAILFDLGIGSKDVRPDAKMGYAACLAASRGRIREGNVGVGTGASVGKLFGPALAMKTGVGTASLKSGRLVVGAIAAVNAFGDVVDPATGAIVAGLRSGRLGSLRINGSQFFANTVAMMQTTPGRKAMLSAERANTIIGVVATNAQLSKPGVTKIAQMAHDGLARTIRPSHTMLDGDTIFALSTGDVRTDITTVGMMAAEAMSKAILRGATTAVSAGGLPGLGRD